MSSEHGPKSASCVDRRAFGQHVRQLRRAPGQTQETLAEDAHLSTDSIRRIEHGSFSPSLDTLGKLSGGLGLRLSTLFGAFETRDRDVDREIADALMGLSDRHRETVLKIARQFRDHVVAERGCQAGHAQACGLAKQ